MVKRQPVEEILASWKRCIRKGLSRENAVTSAYVKEVLLQKALSKSGLLISLFENLEKDMDYLTVSNNLAFFLMNAE
ncbi:MAG TPA: LuxR family transcriptional regulator, partial [Clostridia bacterium]|nr:LuxR family transcriptional regulator [Clostridia bacterium]